MDIGDVIVLSNSGEGAPRHYLMAKLSYPIPLYGANLVLISSNLLALINTSLRSYLATIRPSKLSRTQRLLK